MASLYATNLQYRWHLHYRVFDHLFRPLRNFPGDLIPSVRLHLYYPCFKCHEQILQKSKFKIKLIFFFHHRTNIYNFIFLQQKMHNKCGLRNIKSMVIKRTFGPFYITDMRWNIIHCHVISIIVNLYVTVILFPLSHQEKTLGRHKYWLQSLR